MKAKIGRLLLILGICGWWGIRPFPVFACSCVDLDPNTPATAFDTADAVFVGRVNGILPSSEGQHISFHVQESWKGVSTTNTNIETGWGSGDCGYGFIPGKEYLVFAYERDVNWVTGICSHTAPVSTATSELSYLRTLPPLTLTPTLSWTTICWGFFLLLCVSLTIILWQNKRKTVQIAKR